MRGQTGMRKKVKVRFMIKGKWKTAGDSVMVGTVGRRKTGYVQLIFNRRK